MDQNPFLEPYLSGFVSAAEVPVEEYPIPELAAPPSDAEQLSHLCSIRHQYKIDLLMSPRVHDVNVHLVMKNPGEHFGIIAHDKQCGRARAKRFVTNFDEFTGLLVLPAWQSDGSWEPHHGGYGWGIPHPRNSREFMAIKRTFQYYKKDGTKTNWIMNMFNTIDEKGYIQHDMVLREIFENKSGDYDPRPQYVQSRPLSFGYIDDEDEYSFFNHKMPTSYGENAWMQPTNGASSSSFHGINGPSSSSAAQKKRKMEQLNNVLFGPPDITDYNQIGGGWPSTDNFISTNGARKKRRLRTGTPRRRSPVWNSFTKVFNMRPDGIMLVWSICNYCRKVIKGDSCGGTSNMLRHRRSCNQHRHDNSGGGGMELTHGHQVPGSSTAMNMEPCSSPALNVAAVTHEQDCPQPLLAAGTTGNTAAGLHQLPAGDYNMWTDEGFLNSLITTPPSDHDI